jgi:Zn-dependent metalloprotease
MIKVSQLRLLFAVAAGATNVYVDIFDCEYQRETVFTSQQDCFWDANQQLKAPIMSSFVNQSLVVDTTAIIVYNNIYTVLTFLADQWKRDSWDNKTGSVSAGLYVGPKSGSLAIADACNQAEHSNLYFPVEVNGVPTGFGPANILFFGNNRDGVSWGTALDVVAHEFAHGIQWATSGDREQIPFPPDYSVNRIDEALAVIEHCCDVVAALVDKWVGKQNEAVYSIFEDIYPPGQPLRYMSNPAKGHNDTDWYPERFVRPSSEPPSYDENKNGYAYQTAGVANLAFYLLSEGGAHPNKTKAKWTGITVPPIGIENAGKIWYDAMTMCLRPGSKIHQLRYCTEKEAADEYKASVAKAWDAVGVTTETDPDSRVVTTETDDSAISGVQEMRFTLWMLLVALASAFLA